MDNKKKFGYKKLYMVRGGVVPEKPLIYRIKYSDTISIMLLLSSEIPPLSTPINNIKYGLPGEEIAINFGSFVFEKTESRFFTEISCLTEYDDTTQNNFEAKAVEFSGIIDYLAGIIGLRLHKQLVLEIISENSFHINGQDITLSGSTNWIELLRNFNLTTDNLKELENVIRKLIVSADEKTRRRNAFIMHWLLHYWYEQDIVDRFVSLFTPLEMILKGYSGETGVAKTDNAKAIQELIQKYGGDQRDTLLKFYNDSLKPSIVDRFELLAKQAALPNFEQDIISFKRFSKVRNAVLHEGNHEIAEQIQKNKEEFNNLEQLTYKYLSYYLFGDANYFLSSVDQENVEET